MSFPTIEIVYKPATDAFIANPKDAALMKPAFDILSAQKGQPQKYYGLEHEDKATGYLFIAWDALEDHQRMMNDAETYPKLGAAVGAFFDGAKTGKNEMIHVRPTSDPYKAFEAPVTELALFTLQEGKSKAELEQAIGTLSDAMNAAGEADGVVSSSWGPIAEKDNGFALFIGWTSVDAHWNAVKNNKTLSAPVGQIKAIATIELVHVPLTKW
ncbi:hypothetical protein C2E23DRAFT_284027 [Lenzites betulinus]|nr:hypothetical protein C2E23DRAFT_284027 [Lenzites betulinus]